MHAVASHWRLVALFICARIPLAVLHHLHCARVQYKRTELVVLAIAAFLILGLDEVIVAAITYPFFVSVRIGIFHCVHDLLN